MKWFCMSDQALWYLENIDVKGIFCPKKLGVMDAAHTYETYQKGEYIYMQDQHADKIFFINDGRVKIGSFGAGGKQVTKAILTTGEVFGELSLIGMERRRDFAVAMEKTELCIVARDQMKNLLRQHNGLTIFLMRAMGSRALAMESRLESLVFKDSRSRVIDFLLDLVEKRGQRIGYEWVVHKFITHQEIANLTATSRQTVTTILNELKNSGIIKFDRKRLLIRELDRLKSEQT